MSYKFFEELFDQQIENLQRKKVRGYYIYAIDGDQIDIAPSEHLIQEGFRGYPCRGNKKETHYLKMYSVQAYDVVNGVVKKFKYSTNQGEPDMARSIAKDLEKNSISIYDRLHCGYETLFCHHQARNKFLIRARCGGDGRNLQKEIFKFRESNKRSTWAVWKPNWFHKGHPDIKVRLVKIKHPKTKEILIFITNLTENEFEDHEVAKLYQRRWDIEGSFRDLTTTLKMEQWHSKKLNGILQEIFALLWLINSVKSACFQVAKKARDWFDPRYEKSNLKLCLDVFMDNVDLLVQRNYKKFNSILLYWMQRSLEKRKRLSRSYPRVVRKRGKDYAFANIIPRRS